ncbi:hypothetical protein HDU97_005746 [Phlyctochytrium planicorne]|nr:hypothetical protein HDU97_005746 [Phlyctochytrium planicorne]
MSMSLAGKTVGAPARSKLWGHVCIEGSHQSIPTRLFGLFGLLQGNPSLGPLVKELELNLHPAPATELNALDTSEWSWEEFGGNVSVEISSSLSCLQSLYLHTKLPAYSQPFLVNCASNLLHLDLSNDGVPPTVIIETKPLFPHLQELFLRDCNTIDHISFVTLVNGCSKLRVVGINGCRKLGNASIHHLAVTCGATLEAVAFGFRQDVSDGSVASLIDNCPLLRALYLDGHDSITEKPILSWIKLRGSSITTIAMSFCDITNQLLEAIALECRNVQSLSFNGCGPSVTDSFIEMIVRCCSKLKILELDGNAGISEQLEEAVLKKFGSYVPSITHEFAFSYKRVF